jgi:hypothetical protein
MSLQAFNTDVREQRAPRFERAFDPDRSRLFDIARLECCSHRRRCRWPMSMSSTTVS